MAFVLQLEELLAPVSEGSACGELEPIHEAQISALRNGIKGKPAVTTVKDGEKIIIRQGQEPNWHLLRATAEVLFLGGEGVNLSDASGSSAKIPFKKVKHLGAAMVLALSALQTDGLPAFADGLALIEGLLEDRWESLHPLPEADSEAPFHLRCNLLAPLAVPFRELNDSWRFIERLYAAPLIESRAHGSLTVGDCLASQATAAKLDLPDGDPVAQQTVTAARLDFSTELPVRRQVLQAAIRSVESIGRVFNEKTQGQGGLDLTPLVTVLKEASAVLEDGTSSDEGGGEEKGDEGGKPPENTVSTRDQAIRKLAEAADYFREHEPASPIPLFLERAQRLAGREMNFLRILEELELGDQAVPAFKKLAGLREQPADASGTTEASTSS